MDNMLMYSLYYLIHRLMAEKDILSRYVSAIIKHNMIKYTLGIAILLFVGLAGGNLILTSIEIGLVYGIIAMLDEEGPPQGPRGT